MIELFMFGNDADCAPRAKEEKPPIGTRIRLSLLPATLVASNGGSRIESRTFGRVAVDQEMFGFSTTARSEFDYKSDLKALYEKFRDPEMQSKRQWLEDFLHIETSKDLIRFRNWTSFPALRIKLLERLLYNPIVDYPRLLSLKSEDFILLDEKPALLRLQYSRSDEIDISKLGTKEKELLTERKRLESTGAFNFWRR